MSEQDDKIRALVERAALLAHEPWQQSAHSAATAAGRAIRYDARADGSEQLTAREALISRRHEALRDAVTFALAAYLAAEEADQ